MEKPFTIKVQEMVNNIVNVVNNSKLPAYVIKNVLQGVYAEVEKAENEEITKYNKELSKKEKE